ncbi:MAG: sulfatase-like hydrolase/transferase [Planctomycetaceae bacterium]|nr:sulfatase-like hydrolase/transferase [Planctomycetaceae bacterium]
MAKSARPNILFFFSDQQRWDTCGCYGQPLGVTPNLDAMARDGVRFANAFTCQPVCGPARACIQTGRWATELSCPTNGCRLPVEHPTVARLLRGAGYECGYIGKWHLASYDGAGTSYYDRPVPAALRGGYDDYWLASDVLEFTSHGHDGHMWDGAGNQRDFPKGRYRVDAQTDWVLEYLDSRRQDRPFFLMTSYIEPHHQNDHARYEGPHGSKDRWADYLVPGDLVGTGGDWRKNYPDYLGQCNSLDLNLGRIRARLEKLGIADNTLIIYTSDHGSHFCTRNSEYKRACHDGCIHIPMVIAGPGFTGGKVIEPLASLIDIPETILAAAGVAVPAFMRGRPLQQVVKKTPRDWPREVFIQISEDHTGRALRTHRWTYEIQAKRADWYRIHGFDYVEAYLYDNQADPHQKTNLVAEPGFASIRAELAARLAQLMIDAGEPRPAISAAAAT